MMSLPRRAYLLMAHPDDHLHLSDISNNAIWLLSRKTAGRRQVEQMGERGGQFCSIKLTRVQ
jgi:hypothetical protein